MMINILRKITSPFLIAWGRTPVLWLWRKPKNDLDALLQIASKYFYPNWSQGKARYVSQAMYFYMLLIWPIRALIIISLGMKRYAVKTKVNHHISYYRQLIDQLKIAFLYCNNPQVYYLFELFNDSRLTQAKSFLLGNTSSALLNFINQYRNSEELEDKLQFSSRMRNHNFPMVDDTAVITDGKITDLKGAEIPLPEADFVVKPNTGYQGQGVLRFEWLGNNQYFCSDGLHYDKKRLNHYLRELSLKDSYLVQPRLVNHPQIADLTNKGFGTCRIITGITPTGTVELIGAAFKMPVGEGVADNFAAGGIASPIDLETGELGMAVAKKCLGDSYCQHPDTGAPIIGRKLPYWQETVALIKRAHQQVADYVFLGWDIGLSKDGPVILETNSNWCILLAQRPSGKGLGSSKFTSICHLWIDSFKTPFLKKNIMH
ncbi:sugar-transfer associated ATP-grasp domain-containing protein [Motiliproteus sp. MSK22-1]|uniref:sugar-transfer associated ATP-grasp domain-containing protein n=1 Tax=Motiliproteus sp. MSK22-1 TaxID=1897630 RepID=UPI000976F511|nr:sugar-transfer associated ATP-grasp domain-containing protein [Motiliproteus sp. MSK22-1]OMH25729.1 hypothetical protein BGP75_24660 [Motiliproteus sp. MSK22-1]